MYVYIIVVVERYNVEKELTLSSLLQQTPLQETKVRPAVPHHTLPRLAISLSPLERYEQVQGSGLGSCSITHSHCYINTPYLSWSLRITIQ